MRAYQEFQGLFTSFQAFVIAPFDAAALTEYRTLRTGRGHLGMRDTKIGAITVSRSALLLTANRKDFEQMPGLRFENWMDG